MRMKRIDQNDVIEQDASTEWNVIDGIIHEGMMDLFIKW